VVPALAVRDVRIAHIYKLCDLRGAALERLFACGSMVLNVLSVFVFSLAERKTKNKKKETYRCE
jgi:hypothetical protein